MNRSVVSLVVASTLVLSGCGADAGEACTAYIDAVASCAAEAYPDDPSLYEMPASTCDAYNDLSGSGASDAADLLNCYADTINAGDCSTPEGYAAAVADISSCVTGG